MVLSTYGFASAATLDLSDWRLETSAEVSLAGEWVFYPEQLLEPHRASREALSGVQSRLPSVFGEPISGLSEKVGYGTYVLKVRLPEFAKTTPLVLQFSPVDTAGRFVVTDVEGVALSPVVIQGVVGESLEATLPQRAPSQLPLQLGLPEVIVIWLQVSNFHQDIGGFWAAPRLAEASHAFRRDRIRSMSDGVNFGLMLLFAVYHLVLYAQGRREKILISFALLCVLVGIRSAVMARYPESFIVDWTLADYEFWLKVEYMTIPLSLIAFTFYFRSFSDFFDRPKWLWRLIFGSGVVLVGIIVVTPTTFATSLLWMLQIHMLLGVCWIVWRLLMAWKAHESYVDLVLIGGVILSLTAIQDLLHARGIIATGHYAHYVFGLFLFLQSLIIARRYAETMDERDDLTQRVLKQASLIAHESDKRAMAEGAQREAERALRVQAEAKVTLFGEAVHHINNPLNHILGSLHGIAARQSEVRKLTAQIFEGEEELSDEATAVKEAYQRQFEAAQDYYGSATSAVERATSTVQLLRALSGVDGVTYQPIHLGDVWELVESRSAMVAKLIEPSSLESVLSMPCIGHPAMYAQALELLLGSFEVRNQEKGTLKCLDEEVDLDLLIRRSGDVSPKKASGKGMVLEMSFGEQVQRKDPERVAEIVQHLLEPYGASVEIVDGGYNLGVLTSISELNSVPSSA